jgi:hypothetical protein
MEVYGATCSSSPVANSKSTLLFGLFFYNFALTNQGTVTWSSGSPSVGGSNAETTTIVNDGCLK